MKLCNLLSYNLIYKCCALCIYTHTHTYILRVWLRSKQEDAVLGTMGYFVLSRWERKLLLPWMQMKVASLAKSIGSSSQGWERRWREAENLKQEYKRGDASEGKRIKRNWRGRKKKKKTFLRSSVDCTESDSAWIQQ